MFLCGLGEVTLGVICSPLSSHNVSGLCRQTDTGMDVPGTEQTVNSHFISCPKKASLPAPVCQGMLSTFPKPGYPGVSLKPMSPVPLKIPRRNGDVFLAESKKEAQAC